MSDVIKVLIVDDSSLIRAVLRKILEGDSGICVIGEAGNGREAVDLVQKLKPAVVIMDIKMPVMDGFGATEQIMAYCPTPILILSSIVDKEGIYTTFNAIAAGAVDVMEKPSALPNEQWTEMGGALIRRVKLVAKAKVITHLKGKAKDFPRRKETAHFLTHDNYKIVAIGASTGGPSVVKQILNSLPGDYNAGILIVQHMTEGFTKNFVEWLGSSCKMKVKIAQEGEKIEKGQALVAPDGFHTVINNFQRIELMNGEKVNGVKPSVDMLFKSVAGVYRQNAVGVLLTGMGVDGAEGLGYMKSSGGATIAQSEESCVVFGMPKAAIERGAADKILSLEDIIYTLKNINKNH
jgi:two-component system chemotaxis response regulator CheB